MAQQVDFTSKTNNPEIDGVFDISPDELISHQNEVEMVDVRRPDEREGELGHIPGSKHIILDQLPQRLAEIDNSKTVVFICRSGARSGRATEFALANGINSAYNLKGGMILWNEKGFATEK
jgi:hydroxyacylglutathione hydrolase